MSTVRGSEAGSKGFSLLLMCMSCVMFLAIAEDLYYFTFGLCMLESDFRKRKMLLKTFEGFDGPDGEPYSVPTSPPRRGP